MQKILFLLMIMTSFGANAFNWQYSEKKDELRDTSFYFSGNLSSNINNLGFPYEENQLRIILRKHLDTQYVLLEMINGQFYCGELTEYENCQFSIKFDNNEILSKEYLPQQGGDNIVFVFEPQVFFEQLKNAYKAIIELNAYQGGKVQYKFDLSGLDIEKSHFQ